ncbi:MAG: TolC family protein [candidate division NC10 bacterium]|nr:TolC family protein [candidate division NC10 bacterium]
MRRRIEVRLCLLLALLIGGTVLLPAEGAEPPRFSLNLDLTLAQAGTAQAPTIPSAGEMPLSLRDGMVLALKNNLDIAVEGFNPRLRAQDLTNEKAVFDPGAFLEFTRSDNRAPSSSIFSPGQTLSDLWDFNAGIRQKLPTGGTYEFRFNNERFNTSSTSTSDGYTSKLSLSLTQPLLKNFGFAATETNIRIATNNQSISREQLRLRVSDIVTQVQNAYFDLIFAIENLEVQRRSLRLAQELVALNKARVRAGVAAPVEVTQAEAQEAARVQDVILAEKAVRDAEDTLKVVLNLPAGGGWGQEIRPTDTPGFEVTPINLDAAIQKAMENRYEYKSAKLDIDNKELSVRLTRNQLLPDLSLTSSVTMNGFGGAYGSDLSELGSGHFISYSVGVVLTVPLGNRAAQASYIKSKLTADQARTSLKQLELQIMQQVREAVRRVEADAKRIEANRAARALAEEQLRVERRRLEAGVTTTFNVLSFQRDLAAVQANEIRAVTDYNKSLANLEKVQGTVLERNRIEM